MSWPRQGSQNPLDNRECKWKTSPSWVWGFEVCMPKGSFEVAPSPQISFTTFVKALAQSECGQFCNFDICGPNWDRHHAEWHEDL